MKELNELMAQRNAIEAQISAITKNIKDQNSIILIEEVRNLRDGVGEGFVSRDYFAPDRYYSRIDGVKNIRLQRSYLTGSPVVVVKVSSACGQIMPSTIRVDECDIEVEIIYSEKYNSELGV